MHLRAFVIAAVLLAVLPASAGAVTFGANLNRAPNNTATCGDADTLFKYGGQPPNPAFNTCSVDFQVPSTGESVFPPSGLGVVTQVRVRVGATTAPMQVVVEEALRKDNPGDPGHPTYACCKAINVSQVFTPAPNQVTTLPVSLPVRSDLAPDPASGYYVDDHLALSVFARDVPIPGSVDQNASDGGWFPAWQKGQERAGAAGFSGLVVLMNADWQQAGSAPGTGGSEGVDIAQLKALRDGTARLVLNLPGPGVLGVADDRAAKRAIVTTAGAPADAARKKKARVKPVRRTIKKAGKVTIRIKPSKAGKRTLRRKHKLRVKLLIRFTPAGSKSSATKTKSVTLKLKRKRRR